MDGSFVLLVLSRHLFLHLVPRKLRCLSVFLDNRYHIEYGLDLFQPLVFMLDFELGTSHEKCYDKRHRRAFVGNDA
jgi:hypothetical protein